MIITLFLYDNINAIQGVSSLRLLTPFTPACNTRLTKTNDQHDTVRIIIVILLSENNYYCVFRPQ